VVVAVDISGSVSPEEMHQFLSEVNAIKGQVRARVTLLACDYQLSPGAPWIFEAWEEARLPEEMQGGGGTSFKPVFEWLDTEGLSPDLLVYFTDAKGEFPDTEPAYPVLWLVKGRSEIPWGQRVQLN
jgi:predicted metal-dependent peptidase